MRRPIQNIKPVLIAMLFSFVSQNCFSGGWLTDSNEKKGIFQEMTSVFIIEPQLFSGQPGYKHERLKDPSPAGSPPVNAIREAAISAFQKSGYHTLEKSELPESISTSPEYKTAVETAWERVLNYSEAGLFVKKKMMPYSIKPSHEALRSFTNADLLVFVQCFGGFEFKTDPRIQVPLAAAGVAATAALTGMISIGTRHAYSGVDFKMSAFDSKTGELIWYREGFEGGTDVNEKGRLMSTFDDIFKGEIPKAKNPYIPQRFKKKRSEININSNE